MALITSIEDLRKYVKINASKDWNSYNSFVNDAQDKYIEPFFGIELLNEIQSSSTDSLFILICRALAPFSLALASAELSIGFGEAGHTVVRTEGLAPASDSKIQAANESLMQRAWENLDRAINYVNLHPVDYPLWQKSLYYVKRSTILFDTAESFQEDGMVFIDSSPLAFYNLRYLIRRIEESETFMFIPADKRTPYLKKETALPVSLKKAMQAYTGSRVAALHTSQVTRLQRGKTSETEFKPVIRPIYSDITDTGNYFDEQAAFWRAQINESLISENIVTTSSQTIYFNSDSKRIFVAGASLESEKPVI
ncbi:MAG: DUF6712 family protein [Proteiniphilum sp.]